MTEPRHPAWMTARETMDKLKEMERAGLIEFRGEESPGLDYRWTAAGQRAAEDWVLMGERPVHMAARMAGLLPRLGGNQNP